MATGVMVDLGIHIDSSHLVERGSITAEEAKARKDLLLSTFVYAAQWSLYLGRPLPISQVTLHATQQAVSEVSSPWVIFCMSMLDIMDILNGPTSVSGLTRETADRLLELNSSLRSLSDSAQSNFSSEKIQLGELDAEMYSFHMQCCGLQILVHRALLKPLPAQGQSDCTQARHSLSESAKEQLYECVHENAIRIGQLVASYLRIFGVDEIVTVMVDNIFIAAVTLITHAHRLDQKGQSDVQSIQWLKFLSNTIRDMQKHFPTTSRMQSCLSKMVEGSSLAFIFPPISASSPSAPHNGLDLLFAQGNTLDVPRLDVNNVSADANQFDFSNLMSAPGTGPFTYEALWNMSPAMFESTAEPFGLSR